MKGLPKLTTLFAYIKNSASATEKIIVEDWLKEDESHEKELLQIARIYHAQYTYNRIKSRSSLSAFANVNRKIKAKKQKKRIRRIATIAACIASVIILSTVLSHRKDINREMETQLITLKSNPGMRTNFTLPDGTKVFLNSGSTFTYPVPYDKKERRVSLVGEGFFNVAHNENQPFIVNVLDDKIRVRVLGTEFNIQAYEEDHIIQTTLLSGSIHLEMNNKENRQLRPGDKATYHLVKEKISVEKVNPLFEIAWIDGKLIFKDTPIPEVLKQLSHFYNVKFEVKDPVIESYHFTGTFQNRQLSQILDYIKISSNIDFEINHIAEDDSKEQKQMKITLWKKEKQ
jgi:ferric-dicitrate binding protein FerR (iron transport regulator)